MSLIELSIVSNIINSAGTLLIGVTAFILWWQIRSNHEWNRRKCTQETLDKLVTGEFPELRKKLEVDLKCPIWRKDKNYKSCTDPLPEEDRKELDDSLMKVLNFFEIIGINMKNNIIDENICYDYVGWIYTEYLRWSQPFIEEIRKKAVEPRVLINFTNYAENWSKRIAEEKKEKPKNISIPGKNKL